MANVRANQDLQVPAPLQEAVLPNEVLPALPADNQEQPAAAGGQEPEIQEPARVGQELPGAAAHEELTIQALKQELDELKVKTSAVSMEASLENVRHLASSPTRFRDPHSIMLAIQKLADDARVSNHARAKEFEAILRQVRPFAFNPQLGDVVTRLMGSKEEAKVAATIAKMMKSNRVPAPAPQAYQPYPRQGFRGRGRGGVRGRARCFGCGQQGHFQRNCPNRR